MKDTIDSIRSDERLFSDSVNEKDEAYKLGFILSPFDMVYMPTEDEMINGYIGDHIDFDRIFVVNDFNDGGVVYFRPYSFAYPIYEKEVDLRLDEKGKIIGSYSDKTANFEGKSIRDNCVPLKVDRLGNIIEINGQKL